MSKTVTRIPRSLNVYPSGCVGEGYVESQPDSFRVCEGHAQVADLWDRYRNRRSDKISPDLLKDITETAKELLQLGRIAENLKSATLSDEMRQFLVDSLNFSVTGKRTVSVEATSSILDFKEVGSKLRPVVKSIVEPALHPELIKPAKQRMLVYNWVNQKNGIHDILCTLHILYVGSLY